MAKVERWTRSILVIIVARLIFLINTLATLTTLATSILTAGLSLLVIPLLILLMRKGPLSAAQQQPDHLCHSLDHAYLTPSGLHLLSPVSKDVLLSRDQLEEELLEPKKSTKSGAS
ncbi:hypothetical protein LOK49_LG03G02896 [Camellia lanceoleosa]|uniref:Uncharacterized protein n=1 Tax=Camellia lanceoleosa TaxID=1840588 RepID=A0ACC0IFH9_9ERIC|nr:hypothetical protein LOK49_LG03G02896 [Camellia lanceoleosa]